MIEFSDAVRRSRARPIIAIWGVWNWLGAVVSIAFIFSYFGGNIWTPKAAELACFSHGSSTNGTLLQSASEFLDASL